MDTLTDTSAPLAIEERIVDGYAQPIRLRLYRPRGIAGLPMLLYFHGGGFIGGSLDDADSAARQIARELGALVVSVGYSLAPRFPFPAAPEDAYAAMRWAQAHADALGGDPRRIAVAGDDAGGNLATCLTLIARDRDSTTFAAQVLIGPMLDPSLSCLDHAAAQPPTGVEPDARICALRYRQYLPKVMQRLHPYAAPIESARLANLPPALILTAQNDPLHVEAEKYAAALIRAGVPTTVRRFCDISHTALTTHAPTLNATIEFLREHLSRTMRPRRR